jgi:hypothetical protein
MRHREIVRGRRAWSQVILRHEGVGVVQPADPGVAIPGSGGQGQRPGPGGGRPQWLGAGRSQWLGGRPFRPGFFRTRNFSCKRPDSLSGAQGPDGRPTGARWPGQSSLATPAPSAVGTVLRAARDVTLESSHPLGWPAHAGASPVEAASRRGEDHRLRWRGQVLGSCQHPSMRSSDHHRSGPSPGWLKLAFRPGITRIFDSSDSGLACLLIGLGGARNAPGLLMPFPHFPGAALDVPRPGSCGLVTLAGVT